MDQSLSWACTLDHRTAVLVMASTLAVIGILFEHAKHKLEEHTSEAMKPILYGFYGELMVGGFMSLLSFILVRLGILESISSKVFGTVDPMCQVAHAAAALPLAEHEEPGKILNELLEQLHVVLFLVFCLFMGQAIFLLFVSEWHERDWKEAERLATNDREDHVDVNADASERRRHHKLLDYIALRTEFIAPSDPLHIKLPVDFAFDEYLSFCMGELVGRLVVITPRVWGVTILFFIANWAAEGAMPNVAAALSLAFGWILLLVTLFIWYKLKYVRELLTPVHNGAELIDDRLRVGKKKKSAAAHGSINADDADDADDEYGSASESDALLKSMPARNRRRGRAPGERPLPPFRHVSKIKPRSWLKALLLGKLPNKHENLFWWDRKGVSFLVTVVSSIMLMSAMYLAILCFALLPEWKQLYANSTTALLGVVGMLPVFVNMLVVVPSLIQHLLFSSSVELLKNVDMIKKVIRHMRTRKTVRCIKLLRSIRVHAHNFKLKAGDVEEQAAENLPELAPEIEEEITEIFHLFDSNKGGSISAREVGQLMSALGHSMSAVEAHAMVQELDLDSNGYLELPEFLLYMRRHAQSTDEQNKEEMLSDLFHLFDKDQNGYITIDEFQSTLDVLGDPLSQEEVLDLLSELDTHGDKKLDMEAFEKLFEKFGDE